MTGFGFKKDIFEVCQVWSLPSVRLPDRLPELRLAEDERWGVRFGDILKGLRTLRMAP